MAAQFSMQDYYRNAQMLQETGMSRRWNDDDDSSILDENILESTIDTSAFESPVDTRRPSMADAAIFSPQLQAGDWDFLNGMSETSPMASNFDNNPFVKMETNQSQFGNAAWEEMADRSETSTPTPSMFNGQTQNFNFDSGDFTNFTPSTGGFEAPIAPALPQGSAEATNELQSIVSNAPSSGAGAGNPAKKPNAPVRPGSPHLRIHSPMHIRRDGIRKKNARFDIPAERTLLNIDALITQSTDEGEIKELKQQKRLLRNRQAALDSRQRKKQHTERLEEEKKVHSAIILELEEKINALALRDNEWMEKEQHWMQEREMLEHHLQYAQIQNEEIVRKHTLESAELRKKNTFLGQELDLMQEKLNQAAMQTQSPADVNYTEEFTFDGMPIDSFWEPPSFTNDSDAFGLPDVADVKVASKVQEIKEEEKPAASGLLFLLLLFGAFVASKAAPSSSLPPIPQPLRHASAAVLNTIFEDAGVKPTAAITTTDPRNVELSVGPSVTQQVSDAWVLPKGDSAQLIGLDSSLAMLNARLEQPKSRAQEAQELMMLTAAEYDEVTSKDFLREQEFTTSEGRQNLQATLSALRKGNTKPTAAEVYTRSLLWDKVDAEVVRRFAAFAQVAASSNVEAA
ncbi:hypothetical protein H072_7690 [Dactylellina haptotyla CBS 200.50]|uniref:BZIP domain-containing protein n=1 Tax=Dactylellina haptotyla (strain CBS 200.50) TaxID=1284197 RepID=S8A6W4_DACHA|nr:hypothetical protein H072_7690 [Dactylellina haptotyla CBS 200.50]